MPNPRPGRHSYWSGRGARLRALAFSSRLCDPDRRTCFVSFESRSGEPPSGNPGGSWFCVFSSLAWCCRPPHWQARSEEPLSATSQRQPVSKAGSQICSCASFRNVSRLLASTCHTASDQTFRGGHINVRSWCIFPERAEVWLKHAGFNSLRQRPSGPGDGANLPHDSLKREAFWGYTPRRSLDFPPLRSVSDVEMCAPWRRRGRACDLMTGAKQGFPRICG